MIKKNPGKDYWEWDIRNSQMRNFVPKFISLSMIAKQPERYGFDVEFAEPLEYDVITIDRCLYLKDIAEDTFVSEKKIRELNPELRRDYIDPTKKNTDYVSPRTDPMNFWPPTRK